MASYEREYTIHLVGKAIQQKCGSRYVLTYDMTSQEDIDLLFHLIKDEPEYTKEAMNNMMVHTDIVAVLVNNNDTKAYMVEYTTQGRRPEPDDVTIHTDRPIKLYKFKA